MMTRYDFKIMLNRSHTGSLKWDEMENINHHLPNEIVPFSLADSDLKLAPEIIEGIKDNITSTLSLGYHSASESYNNSVKRWFKKRHHYDIKDEWIVQTPGVVSAINFAIRALTNEDDGIIVMTPVYYPFFDTIKQTHRKLVEVPLLNQGHHYDIDFDTLEAALKNERHRLLILCNPHNPIGRVWRREELTKIAELCLAHDVIMISDEIHSDIIMKGYQHTMLSSLSEEIEQHTITCTAASKTFNIAGQCVSNIIIPNDEWRAAFIKTKESVGIKNVSTLGLLTTQVAYDKGEDWLEAFLQLVAHNHQLVKTFFKTYYPEVNVFDLEGTYLQWVDFRALGFNPAELETFLDKEALDFFDQGYIFGDNGNGFERINLAASSDSIKDMLQRFKEAMDHHISK